jgi:5'-methylthioadenosine phosphorylase
MLSDETADIGIIGGTGVYDPTILEDTREIKVYTPYGETSDFITIGVLKEKRIAFLPRHGRGHRIPPHLINSRANIWALKQLGVKRILAPSAVGSLRDQLLPGDMVISDQFIDRTKARPSTFFDGPRVCHVSMADPFCPELRKTTVEVGKSLGLRIHDAGTYVCIEGPRFSTRAESKMFRSWGADIIGMTLVPECVLAREAEICYINLATITDFDVWAEKPVSNQEVVETLLKSLEKIKLLLVKMIPTIQKERICECKDALKNAIV